MNRVKHLLPLTILVGVASFASAGQVAIDNKSSPAAPCTPDTIDWVTLSGDYTFDSNFERGHHTHGDSAHSDFEYDHRIELRSLTWPNADCGHWYLRLGMEYERWDFSNSGGLPIPNTLQHANGILALEYVVNDNAGIMLETRPGVYFEHHVGRNTFDAPSRLYFPIYHHSQGNTSSTVILGVAYSNLFEYQWLPIVGLDYTVGKWDIRAVAPEPRITYQATDKLGLWIGGGVNGGAFRVDHHDYPTKADLNHAVLTYSEVRAGGGFTYKIERCTLEVGAGYAFERKFDYTRAEQGFKTNNGAPFVTAEMRIGF